MGVAKSLVARSLVNVEGLRLKLAFFIGLFINADIGNVLKMKKILLGYKNNIQRISCIMSYEPIFYTAYNTAGYIQPVELENH